MVWIRVIIPFFYRQKVQRVTWCRRRGTASLFSVLILLAACCPFVSFWCFSGRVPSRTRKWGLGGTSGRTQLEEHQLPTPSVRLCEPVAVALADIQSLLPAGDDNDFSPYFFVRRLVLIAPVCFKLQLTASWCDKDLLSWCLWWFRCSQSRSGTWLSPQESGVTHTAAAVSHFTPLPCIVATGTWWLVPELLCLRGNIEG